MSSRNHVGALTDSTFLANLSLETVKYGPSFKVSSLGLVKIITNQAFCNTYIFQIKNYETSERKMSSFVSPQSIKAAKTTDRKLIFIPIMLVLLRIWGTVRYVLFIVRSNGDMINHPMHMADKVLLSFQVHF